MATTKALELGQFGTDLTVDDSTGAVTIANTVNSNTFSSTGIDDNADQTVITIGSDESVTLAGTLDVNGTEILVGTSDSRFAENNLRFNATGSSYIDVATTGQSLNFRVSNASALDTTALILSSDGNATFAGELRGPSLFIIDPSTYDTDSDAGSAAGTVRIRGDLIVDGDTTTINSTTLTVADLKIVAAEGATADTDGSSAAADGAGLYIGSDTSPIASLKYDDTSDGWQIDKALGIGTGPDMLYSDGVHIYGTNPSIKLEGSTTSAWEFIHFKQPSYERLIGMRTTGAIVINNGTNLDANNHFVVEPAGNVGINYFGAPKKLSVNVTADADGVFLYSNSTEIGALARTTVGATVVPSLDGVAGRDIHIGGRVNTDVILANAGGNVGIGTDNPSTKLEVDGEILATTLSYNNGTGSATSLSTSNLSSTLNSGSKGFQIITSASFTAKNASNNPWITANDDGVDLYSSATKRVEVTDDGINVVSGSYRSDQVRHSIRPSLLLDFANSKVLDPRISFTRASVATYYDGKTTAKAEENMLKYSTDLSNAYYLARGFEITSSTETAPDGTSTAFKFTENGTNSNPAILPSTNTGPYGELTFSVWLKADSASTIYISNDGGTLQTQVNLTTSWQRFEVTGSFVPRFHVGGFGTVTFGGGQVFYMWGPQHEYRDSATAYTPTTSQPIIKYLPKLLTASANKPRFNHYPTTGESRGLLVEEARTNLLSESVAQSASWGGNLTTSAGEFVLPNETIAPDGTNAAAKIGYNYSAGSQPRLNLTGISLSANTYTMSFYAKSGEWNYISASFFYNTYVYLTVDLSDGSVTATNISASDYSIQNVGNGWYRIALTYTSPGTLNNNATGLWPSKTGLGAGFNTAGESIGGVENNGIYVWGAQIEVGGFPTSYIPTSGSAGTRPQEVTEITGTNFTDWYIGNAWSAYIEFDTNTTNTYAGAMSFNDGTSNERAIFAAKQASDGLALNVRGQGNATQAYLTTTTGYANDGTTLQRIAGTVGLNDHAFSGNGTATQTDTSGTVPSGINRLGIGTSVSGTTEPMTGHVRKIAYYPTRLTNAQLQALTEE